MADLCLDTIPSSWTHPYVPLTPEPYHRVIGVETASGIIACKYEVDTTELQRFTFDVPDDMAERVATFFEAHLAHRNPEPTDASYNRRAVYQYDVYNCHAFARYVLTGEVLHNPMRWASSFGFQQAVRARPFTGNLAVGQHGVVFSKSVGHASHSFLGLGEGAPLTLQAMNNNSNMGLLPYDQILPIFGRYPEDGYKMLAVPVTTS